MMVIGQNRSGALVSPTEALFSQAVGGSTKPAVPVAKLYNFENELGVQAPVGFWDPAGCQCLMSAFPVYRTKRKMAYSSNKRCSDFHSKGK